MEAEFCAENILRQDLIHSETNLREGERWDRGVTRGGEGEEFGFLRTCFPEEEA